MNIIWAGLVNLASMVTGTLPVANGGTGITSLGTGVATFLGTPSSANLKAAVTDETGSGSLVFATAPQFDRIGIGMAANATYPLSVDKGAGSGVVQQWVNGGGFGAYLIIGASNTAYFAVDTSANSSFGISSVAFDVYLNGPRYLTLSTTVLNTAASSFGLNSTSSPDVILVRDAAAVLAVRNSTTAQSFRLYNTWTDASNGEWLSQSWVSNIIRLGATKNGTGTARVLTVDYGGTSTAALSIPITSGAVTFGGGAVFPAAAPVSFTSGTNQRAGNATMVGGTVTVSNTTVTANTVVMLTRKTSGGTIGTAITYTLSAGTSFTVNSDNILDTSTFSYVLIEVP